MLSTLPRTREYCFQELSNIEPTSFDCGDDQLNGFFNNDAIDNEKSLLSKIYFLTKINDTFPLVGFSISNAQIDANSEIDSTMPPGQHYNTYPAVRIGKFATNVESKRKGYGKQTMTLIKYWFRESNKTGCRFIIVDSRKTEEAEGFYKRNGFEDFPVQKDHSPTKLMYYAYSCENRHAFLCKVVTHS